MGYNTTVVIFNDALDHQIANDPLFGVINYVKLL